MYVPNHQPEIYFSDFFMGCNEHLVVPDDSISLSLARRGVSQLAGEPRSLSTYRTYK